MNKLILQNFAVASNGLTPGSISPHRFIQGFVPPYFALASEAADTTLKQKLNPPYPLVLSPGVTSIQSKASKYPLILVPNEGDSLGNVIYSTNLWEIFVDDASETSLGIPNGTPASNVNIDLCVFNGKILTSHPLNTRIYHGAINATPSWTASTGTAVSSGMMHILKRFEDRLLVVDASSGAFTRKDRVLIMQPDFSVGSGIDLGDSYDIQDVGNYQDRYAILYTHKTTSPRLSQGTTAFLWNGVAGDSYDQKYILRGKYTCGIEKEGASFAFTQVGTTLVCYEFTGGGFREVARLKNTVVSTSIGVPKSRISIEGDYFVILCTSSGNTSGASPLYWNPFTGEAFFLVKAISSLSYKAITIALDESTNLYKRYLSYENASAVGILYGLTMENSAKADMGADYKSNFIPMPEVKGIHDPGRGGRGLISKVEIEYNTPPSSSDIIAFTLTTKDEEETETYGTTTATIKNTTANSTSAEVGTKRAIIEVGKQATEFSVELSLTVATTSWNLIIRRIVIYYEPTEISE